MNVFEQVFSEAHDRSRQQEVKPPIHEAQIEELKLLLARETRQNPFKVGDVVTPRPNSVYHGEGEPHVVVEVLSEPVRSVPSNIQEACVPYCYSPLDLLVGGYSRGGEYLVWLQRSAELVPYFGEDGKPMNIAPVPAVAQPVEADDDWIDWTGGENPVPGEHVVVKLRSGTTSRMPLPSDHFIWSNEGCDADILAYRVVS